MGLVREREKKMNSKSSYFWDFGSLFYWILGKRLRLGFETEIEENRIGFGRERKKRKGKG